MRFYELHIPQLPDLDAAASFDPNAADPSDPDPAAAFASGSRFAALDPDLVAAAPDDPDAEHPDDPDPADPFARVRNLDPSVAASPAFDPNPNDPGYPNPADSVTSRLPARLAV